MNQSSLHFLSGLFSWIILKRGNRWNFPSPHKYINVLQLSTVLYLVCKYLLALSRDSPFLLHIFLGSFHWRKRKSISQYSWIENWLFWTLTVKSKKDRSLLLKFSFLRTSFSPSLSAVRWSMNLNTFANLLYHLIFTLFHFLIHWSSKYFAAFFREVLANYIVPVFSLLLIEPHIYLLQSIPHHNL